MGISDSTGIMQETVMYDPYGQPYLFNRAGQPLSKSQFGNSFYLAGRPYTRLTGWNSGIYDMRHRFYAADIGRFMQGDPLGFKGGDNLYAYAGNNPVSRTDPSGLMFAYQAFATAAGGGGPDGSGGGSFGVTDYSGGDLPLVNGAGDSLGIGGFSGLGGFSGEGSYGGYGAGDAYSGSSNLLDGFSGALDQASSDLGGSNPSIDGNSITDGSVVTNILNLAGNDILGAALGVVGDVWGIVSIPYYVYQGIAFGNVTGNYNGAWGAFTSALIPKWGWYAGPNWGIDGPAGWLGIGPLSDPIDEAAYFHDLSYAALNGQIYSGSLTYTQANSSFLSSDQMLRLMAEIGPEGPLGTVYNGLLQASFGILDGLKYNYW